MKKKRKKLLEHIWKRSRTQRAFAIEMCVDESLVSLWVSGARDICWDKYGRKMARMFGITKEDFELLL